jgi:hypothetical protein
LAAIPAKAGETITVAAVAAKVVFRKSLRFGFFIAFIIYV